MIKFSIIIPVYHESSEINRSLRQLSTLKTKNPFEIIVVDGDPKESTLKVIKVNNIRKLKSAKGRARQMNFGAKKAKGSILLFLHADTELPKNGLLEIQNVLNNDKIKAGAFDLGFNTPKLMMKIIAKVSSWRSRITRIPYGDQTFFIRKDYFWKIGGFKEIPLMEDVELMKRIRKQGDKISIISDTVKTSSRRWEEEGLVYTTLRNWGLTIFYFFGVSPKILVRFYR